MRPLRLHLLLHLITATKTSPLMAMIIMMAKLTTTTTTMTTATTTITALTANAPRSLLALKRANAAKWRVAAKTRPLAAPLPPPAAILTKNIVMVCLYFFFLPKFEFHTHVTQKNASTPPQPSNARKVVKRKAPAIKVDYPLHDATFITSLTAG